MSTCETQQQAMMNAEPQKEHQWLQKLVGEWTIEGEATMGPDQPAIKSEGSESVRSLGGLWVLCEGQGEIPGGCAANTLMTLGYDTQKKRYVGTWVGSMMTNLWVYEGTIDADEKVLTLEAVMNRGCKVMVWNPLSFLLSRPAVNLTQVMFPTRNGPSLLLT